MGYRVCALLLLAIFYAFYFAKIIGQRRQSIQTNQMGVGEKPRNVLWIERILSVATLLTVAAEGISIFETPAPFPAVVKIIGVVVGIVAVIFFASATTTMKNSWRVGIPQEKTAMITDGIYRVSRNPAFVGFDLLYLSILLLFFNIPLLVISVWAMIMLHLQILQEERWLSETFPDEYSAYRAEVYRYLGRKG